MFWSEKSLLMVSFGLRKGFLLLDELFIAIPPNSKLILVPFGRRIVKSQAAAAVDVAVLVAFAAYVTVLSLRAWRYVPPTDC